MQNLFAYLKTWNTLEELNYHLEWSQDFISRGLTRQLGSVLNLEAWNYTNLLWEIRVNTLRIWLW